jgi:hypothetical protein
LYSYSYKTHKINGVFDGKESITNGFVQSGGEMYIANAIGIGTLQNGKLNFIYRHPH